MFQARKSKINKILKTVLQNFERMTNRDTKEKILARTTQSRLGNMTDKNFKEMVSANGPNNSSIHSEHIANTAHVFGPNVAGLEGKLCAGRQQGFTTTFPGVIYGSMIWDPPLSKRAQLVPFLEIA